MNNIGESFPVKYAIAWTVIKRYQNVANDNDTTNNQDGTIEKEKELYFIFGTKPFAAIVLEKKKRR
ncbi:hypothetical protein CU098_005862, partial [Rhizopus stolonifer]